MLKRTIQCLVLATFTIGSMQSAAIADGLTVYNVTIHTADKSKAGTDSDVSIRFHNDKGRYSKVYPIDTPGDSFERNRWDICIINAPKDYGKLTGVTLISDNSGKNAGWLPEWVFITNMETGDRWVFCNFDNKFVGGDKPSALKLGVARTMQLNKRQLAKFKDNTHIALARQRAKAKGKSNWQQFKDGLDEAAEVSEDLGRIGKNLGSALNPF